MRKNLSIWIPTVSGLLYVAFIGAGPRLWPYSFWLRHWYDGTRYLVHDHRNYLWTVYYYSWNKFRTLIVTPKRPTDSEGFILRGWLPRRYLVSGTRYGLECISKGRFRKATPVGDIQPLPGSLFGGVGHVGCSRTDVYQSLQHLADLRSSTTDRTMVLLVLWWVVHGLQTHIGLKANIFDEQRQ